MVARAAAVFCLLASCVPTAARTNAKVTPGFEFGLNAGSQLLFEGTNGAGEATEPAAIPHAELDLQRGRVRDDGSAYSIGIKIPINLFFTSLDLYYQFPAFDDRTYLGLGAEVSFLAGVYGSITHYVADGLFVTLTSRALNAGKSEALLNSQVAFGYASDSMRLSLFASYVRHTGDGFDFEIDLFSDEDRKDLRKQFGLVGVSLQY